uniref:Guanine nucleotide-binding protein G(I) subunit alpha n=1 Tax=Rhabditophanes sp. KR3021 TaxID=114890 RepID=A0AC35TWB6_9BILA
MGICQSEEDKTQLKQNKEIEKGIKDAKSQEDRTIKLLLLGAGECGKSTVMKQMRLIHHKGFTAEEMVQQKSVVYSNVMMSMKALLDARKNFGIQFQDPTTCESAEVVIRDAIAANKESDPPTIEVIKALKALWGDTTINIACYDKRVEINLQDSAKYFFDSLDRLADPSYCPTDNDMLFTRIKTTGVVSIDFSIKGATFKVFDVGGQRSERKKWIHCFENVNAIIFVVAVSEYNEVLFEDETTNRMTESMRLFESICNSKWFNKTSIILFLNKKDLFAEKVRNQSINYLFKDYKGPDHDYDASMTFISTKFEDLNATKAHKQMYVHHTCATDTNQVQLILDSVVSMIVQTNLHKSGLY